MDSGFFISIFTLVAGFVGGFFLLIEWLRHRRRHSFVLMWSFALLLLNWFQIPNLFYTVGLKITYTDFNSLFLWSTQFNFLAYLFIFFGIRLISNNPFKRKSSYLFPVLWFAGGLLYYYFLYNGNRPIQSPWQIVGGLVFFFIPIHVLILKLLVGACHNKTQSLGNRTRLGLRFIMLMSVSALARYIFMIYYSFIYPPSLALPLARASSFYVLTQAFGILILVVGFFLLHKEIISENPNGSSNTKQEIK